MTQNEYIGLINAVNQLENPYPAHLFKSDIGAAARNAYEAARLDVIDILSLAHDETYD
jgi:hypothetical protein